MSGKRELKIYTGKQGGDGEGSVSTLPMPPWIIRPPMIPLNLMEQCFAVTVFQSDIKQLKYKAKMVKNVKII